MRPDKQKFLYLDYKILLPYLILCVVGIVMVYSASSDILLVNGFKPTVYVGKQLIYFIVAVIFLGYPAFNTKMRKIRSWRFIMSYLGISVFLLLILLAMKIIGGARFAVNGAVGWINLGFISIQPLEIAKLALILYLAKILDKRANRLVAGNIWHSLSNPTIIAFAIMALVIVEPDFGGTAILFMIVMVLYAVSGIRAGLVLTWMFILLGLVIGFVSLIIVWNPKFLQNSYQFQRLLAFAHPFQLEKTSGAQLVNSYYAIHNGGLFGVGLGNSMQKRGYLPEPYTDFIMSIISEELGSIGACLILGLLFYLMWRIMEVGVHAQSQFNALVCFGVTTIIFTETLFNIGAVIGLLPITGVTLPFISYGGSSMFVLTAGIGLVLNISAEEKRAIMIERSVQ
ncbi:FtsW/RodA/SpoVE family cell cycle protein [Lactobacillus jensenii]|uniref:FtsW/RodA/SpoVE family cell cycle protein n=1 Tax=Lactobacillus jensenii TaxID=109790 RepID=UPI0014303C4F|nr:cell division protein FtsW [Lactobacillus jensenii]NJJ08633.1 cell division protein FtsW [Lactobacillus jensenii]